MIGWWLACAPPAAITSADCGSCHLQQQRTWAASLHAAGERDPVYAMARAEAFDPAWCDTCHVAEEGGVGCVTCHVRQGWVVSGNEPSREARAAHRVRQDPELGGEACGGCHQFDPPPHQPGAPLGGAPLQDTIAEWRAWGAARSCADCHLGEHGHRMPGAHDPDLRARGLAIRVRREGDEVVVRLTGDAGHAIPTGDAFHRVEVALGSAPDCDPPIRVVRFGRHLELVDGRLSVVADTRIGPGERTVEQRVVAPGATHWCARYVFAEASHLGRLDPVEGAVPLGSGPLRP